MAFADCDRAMRAAGSGLDAAYVVGGGARSDQWLQIIAAVTGLTLLKPRSGDLGAALGAARLAAACAEDDISDRIFAAPAVGGEVRPDPELAANYAEKYDTFRRAYPQLRSLS